MAGLPDPRLPAGPIADAVQVRWRQHAELRFERESGVLLPLTTRSQ